jgi:mono/diheme cytochrome c family protein
MLTHKTTFLCGLLTVAALGCSSAVNPLEGDPEAEAAGAVLYVDEGCITCHGPDLQGTRTGPSILDEASSASDGKIQKTIQQGKGSMPDFAHLTDTEVWQVVSYLRTVP